VFAIILAKTLPHGLGAGQAHLPTTMQALKYFAFEADMRLVAED
jgi:hypothetical protein